MLDFYRLKAELLFYLIDLSNAEDTKNIKVLSSSFNNNYQTIPLLLYFIYILTALWLMTIDY